MKIWKAKGGKEPTLKNLVSLNLMYLREPSSLELKVKTIDLGSLLLSCIQGYRYHLSKFHHIRSDQSLSRV